MRSTLICMLVISGSLLLGAGLAAQQAGEAGRVGTPVNGDVPLHPIEVRNPPTLGTVDTGLRDVTGASVGVACATCHDPDHPDALARKAEVPEDFHGAIELQHGSLRCASCHDMEDRSKLRLAHGESIPMREVLQLCGQCHGPQTRNFWKGSHGGGRGYWDRSQGPWIRNSCVACHAAHAPAYPTVMPARPPNDRFTPAGHAHPPAEEEASDG